MAKQIPSDGPLLGIDYGGYLIAKGKQRMLLAIGDFDSVNVGQLQEIKQYSDEVIVLPREKDQSDTESAILWAKEHGYDEIVLWGAMHGRVDHFLSNILLIYHLPTPVVMVDEKNRLVVLGEGVHTIDQSEYVYLSLAVLKTAKISLEGVKYPLYQKRIVPGSTYTISNEIIEKRATLTVYHGKVIVMQSKD